MKLIKLLTITACAFALVASSVRAEDKADKPKKTCCQKAKAKGEDCSHPCCVEAKKDGKACEKCNPKKEAPKPEAAK